jgi:hypothetical protein
MKFCQKIWRPKKINIHKIRCRSGVNVMITVVCHFHQFSAKELAIFKKNVLTTFSVHVLSRIAQFFRQIFRWIFFEIITVTPWSSQWHGETWQNEVGVATRWLWKCILHYNSYLGMCICA